MDAVLGHVASVGVSRCILILMVQTVMLKIQPNSMEYLKTYFTNFYRKIMSEVYTPTRRWCPVDMKTLGCAWTHPALPIMLSFTVIARRKKGCFTPDWFRQCWGLYSVIWVQGDWLCHMFEFLQRFDWHCGHHLQGGPINSGMRILHTSYCIKRADIEFAVRERTFWIHSRDFRLPACSALCPVLLSHKTLDWRLPRTLLFLP
jgi:hypothetical protein